MAGINFLGSYSGIDQSTIDQLMQIEKLPLNQLTRKKTDITAQQNAWKDVNTRLKSLFDKLKTLQNLDTFTSKTGKSSKEDVANITVSNDAVVGKYDINVIQLATSTRIIGNEIDNVYDEEGKFQSLGISGSFIIKNNDYVNEDERNFAQITINEGDSLKNIVDKINAETKKTGINATIIGSQIVLTDEKTGERGITLEDTDNILGNLGLEEGTTKNGEQAVLKINSIEVTSDSNTVKNAVLGLTLDLNKVGESTITVSNNTEKLTKAVQDFVDQYNSTMSFIEEQLAPGTVTEDGTTGRGTLAGDSSLRSLHSALRRLVTESLGAKEGITTIKDISQLGVSTTDKTGRLSFNSSKLLEQFEKDPQSVINFFSDVEGTDGADNSIGFISKINKQIDAYISSKDGLIKSKNESYERSLRDLNKRIDDFNDRIERKEQYYIKMFAALDTAMMQAESQLSWLSGQISAMNAQAAATKR
jgi:flagellar hook-associated protein 2